jgi:hypothetical protein
VQVKLNASDSYGKPSNLVAAGLTLRGIRSPPAARTKAGSTPAPPCSPDMAAGKRWW